MFKKKVDKKVLSHLLDFAVVETQKIQKKEFCSKKRVEIQKISNVVILE